MAITITHPGALLLAPALETLADVVAGDWTSAARLCADRLKDPRACALDLDAAAARAGVTPTRRQPYRYRLHHWMLVVDEYPALLCAALDLHMKLWMGQWESLELVAPTSRNPQQGWRAQEVLEVRTRHQRTDAWSSRLYACQNLSCAPPTARLAHHVMTTINGAAVRHSYVLPAGPAAVHVC